MNEQPPRIVIVGSINMDLVARVARLPRAGETVDASELAYIPGGKGANQAVAAQLLGAHATMVGRVGDDVFANSLLDSLRSRGVNSDRVQSTPGCSSGLALIGVEESGENAITIVSGANGHLSAEDVRQCADLIAAADAVLVQLEVPYSAVIAAVELARRNHTLAVLDPAPAPVGRGLPRELFSIDILSPNQTEAECLTGIQVNSVNQAKGAAQILRDRGARMVVIKLGADGALICDEARDFTHVLPPRVKVVDTTAAGDAFTAAMTVAYCRTKDLAGAVRFACAAGACATTRLGAQQSMPTLDKVTQLLES